MLQRRDGGRPGFSSPSHKVRGRDRIKPGANWMPLPVDDCPAVWSNPFRRCGQPGSMTTPKPTAADPESAACRSRTWSCSMPTLSASPAATWHSSSIGSPPSRTRRRPCGQPSAIGRALPNLSALGPFRQSFPFRWRNPGPGSFALERTLPSTLELEPELPTHIIANRRVSWHARIRRV